MYVHPVHRIFPFVDLTAPRVTLARFFELLDTIDPIDRNVLIDLVAFAFRVEPDSDDDDEAGQAEKYTGLKRACEEVDIMEHFVLRCVAQEIMNIQHRWAQPESADDAVKYLNRFIEFRRQRGASEDSLEKFRIMAESQAVTKKSDIQVARRRYDLFCDKVIGPLIGYDPQSNVES